MLLLNKCSYKFSSKFGIGHATRLGRVRLQVGCRRVELVSLLVLPNLEDKEDGRIRGRLIELVSLATRLLECLHAALEERIAERRDVFGFHLADDVQQQTLALGLAIDNGANHLT